VPFLGYQENPLFSVLYDFIAQGKAIWSVFTARKEVTLND